MTAYRAPSRLVRKWRKFRREPVRFFADAKVPFVRWVGLRIMAVYVCVFDSEVPRIAKCALFGRRRDKTFELTLNAEPTHLDFNLSDARDFQGFTLAGMPPLKADSWIGIELCANGGDFGTWLQPVLMAEYADGTEAALAGLPAIKDGRQRTLVRIPKDIRALSVVPIAAAKNSGVLHVRVGHVTRFHALGWLLRGGYMLSDALIELSDRIGSRQAAQLGVATDNLTSRQHIQLIRESMHFCPEFYLAIHEDVWAAGLDAAEHYYRFGGKEGRNPGPKFDTIQYLHDNPDVRLAGLNALVHYVRYGRKERRTVHWSEMPIATRPLAPKAEDWDALERRFRRRKTKTANVDVVVPVYGAFDDALACLYSVLDTSVRTGYQLIVIDDDSPDPELIRELRRLAGRGFFELHRNEVNRGFVESANLGMAMHRDRDVVLLNSDTIVYGNWLDRLRRHALAAPDVATVTPLSNNATICSYPRSNYNNDTLMELRFSALDRLTAKVNRGHVVETPTGVGFCMYIRRDCLDAVGLFDAARFGRGYGEENDLCQKAIRRGMRNLIATDVFVRHTGEVSFAGTTTKAKAKALRQLVKLFPDYERDVADFIARDPVARARRSLDLARLAHAAGGPDPVLYITHSRGGGVERHIRDTIAAQRDAGNGAILLRSVQGRTGEITLNTVDELFLPNLNPVLRDGAVDNLGPILRQLGVSRIEIHNFADYPLDAVRRVGALVKELGVPHGFTVHDYLSVCPRINLIDSSGIYCGEGGEAACRACLAGGDTLPDGRPDIAAWRADYGSLLSGAAAVHAPSRDAARRITRYFPNITVTVHPHAERLGPPVDYRRPNRRPDEPLRVAVIGAIGPHKGSAVLLECARDALKRELPLHFVIVGYSDRRDLEKLPNVTVTGRYAEDRVFDLIAQQHCHIAFLPSVWPETYCYTLSIAQAAGLPVAAFDLGAIRERVQNSDRGVLLPLSSIQQPATINDALLSTETTGLLRTDVRRLGKTLGTENRDSYLCP